MHISSKIMASGDDAKGHHRVSERASERASERGREGGWKQVLCSCNLPTPMVNETGEEETV